jgi:hypothetical protein
MTMKKPIITSDIHSTISREHRSKGHVNKIREITYAYKNMISINNTYLHIADSNGKNNITGTHTQK